MAGWNRYGELCKSLFAQVTYVHTSPSLAEAT